MCRSWGLCAALRFAVNAHPAADPARLTRLARSVHSTDTDVCVLILSITQGQTTMTRRAAPLHNRLSHFIASLKTLFLWETSCCDSHRGGHPDPDTL